MKRTAMVGLLALVSWSAQAAHDVPGARIGIAASFADFQGDDVPDPTLDSRFIEDNAVGFKLYGQYQFNKWFALEGAYVNTGDFKDENPNDVPPSDLKLYFSGFSASGLLYVPMPSDEIEAFVKAGYYNFDDDLSVNNSTTSTSSESGLVAGAGLAFEISEHIGIRAEYEWYDADVGDLSMVNIGMEYYFGGEKPAPVVAPPPPPPEPVAAPPPPPPPPPADSDGDGVTDDNDACPDTPAGAKVNARGCEEQLVLQGVTFENNSDQLTPNSTLTLDSVAEILKRRPNFKVEVRGHTDSTGSEEYNMKLSEHRAEAVMDYLISRGVPADKLSANGYGDTQPVAPNDTADGRAQNRRVALEFTESN